MGTLPILSRSSCGMSCYRHDIPQEERDKMGNVPIPHAWFIWECGQPSGTLLGHIGKADA